MAYVEIKDFKSGLDTRRPAIVGESGSLIDCKNGHITRGGDVESVKVFAPNITLPANTFGLHSSNNKLYVFGSGAAPTNLPGIVVYQRLLHPGGLAMTSILSTQNFKGKIYAVAEFADGAVFHYYDGTLVSDWNTLAGSIADNATVALRLADKIDALDAFAASASSNEFVITAANAGTAFTISVLASGAATISKLQLQANVAAVTEVRATATFEVDSGSPGASNRVQTIVAGATALIASPVLWVLDADATAHACATAINADTDTHGYTATSAGAVVTITGPAGEGATANGRVLSVTANGSVIVSNVTNFASGVTAVAAVPQIERVTVGTYSGTDTYTVTLNGTNYTITGVSSMYGRIVKAFKTKMHGAVRALLYLTAVDSATAWTSGTGDGFLDVSSQDEGSQLITALGVYQNLFAIFTRITIQIWAMDPDPTLNTFRQLLENTGTRSPKAVIGYGNSDLLYVSDTGIRSLKARDSSNAAFVDDIGTKIDDHVVAFLATLTEAEIENASGIISPTDGRAWVALKNRIYVFSYFPGSRVSAWSYYEPGFTVENMAVVSRSIYLRSGNTLYLYGGTGGATYPEDDVETTIQVPFLDAQRIGNDKKILGVDIICSGEWKVEVLIDPRDEALKTEPLYVSGPTTLLYKLPVFADTSHFAPLLTSAGAGRKTLSSVVVHFEDTE